MGRILMTAFEPYDGWTTNSSWLSLIELTKDRPPSAPITTRLYPVDYQMARERLERDLRNDFDIIVHLGQAPGSTALRFETFALNTAEHVHLGQVDYSPLCAGGPAAYQSALSPGRFVELLRARHIPAQLSHHAGTYLCNAVFYWSHYLCERHGYKSRCMFIHLPLDVSQVADLATPVASLPLQVTVQGLRIVLEYLMDERQAVTS
jgi:pyroglutamyl-peptidase